MEILKLSIAMKQKSNLGQIERVTDRRSDALFRENYANVKNRRRSHSDLTLEKRYKDLVFYFCQRINTGFLIK